VLRFAPIGAALIVVAGLAPSPFNLLPGRIRSKETNIPAKGGTPGLTLLKANPEPSVIKRQRDVSVLLGSCIRTTRASVAEADSPFFLARSRPILRIAIENH